MADKPKVHYREWSDEELEQAISAGTGMDADRRVKTTDFALVESPQHRAFCRVSSVGRGGSFELELLWHEDAETEAGKPKPPKDDAAPAGNRPTGAPVEF